jgi:glutaredoxin-like YruB-family protein
MAKVTIYTTPTCGYCRATKAFLNEHNIPFTEHDVANDSEKANEMIEKSGQMGVPVIDIDGTIVVGFNQSRLSELLKIP